MGGVSAAETDQEVTLDARTILEDFGLTKYEIDAYLALLPLGIAEAKDICQRSGVPTSKIYDAMARLESLGLVDVQHSRPKKYMARDVSTAIGRLKAKKEEEITAMKQRLPVLETQLAKRARTKPQDSPFWSVAMGWDEFVDKHLVKATEAKDYYYAVVDHAAIVETTSEEVLERAAEMIDNIKKNIRKHQANFRLLAMHEDGHFEEAQDWALDMIGERNVRTVRFTTERVPSFHLMDDEGIVMLIPNPVRPAETLGSVFVTDADLATEIRQTFEELWSTAQRADPES